MSKLLVTGGAGFIGSAFIRLSLAEDPSVHVVNLDKLTYAGNLENLEAVANDPRYRFVHGDVCDEALVDAVLSEEQPDVRDQLARHFYLAGGRPAPPYRALLASLHRRSLRQPGPAARSPRKLPAESQQPVFGFQSRRGPAGALLFPHL